MLPLHGMPRRPPASIMLTVLALAVAACNRVEEPISERRPAASSPSAASRASASASEAPIATTEPPVPPLAAPAQLLTLASSAYQASLFADDEAIELLTSTAAYRLQIGQEPLERSLDLGFGATVTRRSYVYWSHGAIWSEPRRAAKPGGSTQLLTLAERPQRFVADIRADEFAFLTRSADDRYALYKVENRRAKKLYASPGTIDALTLIGGALYFVERPDSVGWRIARVQLAGGEPTFTARKTGRWPANLSGTKNVVYYDGGRRDVLALTLDLREERTLAKDFICSPLAAAANVYCSTMEGVFEVPPAGNPRRVVPLSRNLITSLAVNGARLAFITDVGGQGRDGLALNVVPLGSSSGAEPAR